MISADLKLSSIDVYPLKAGRAASLESARAGRGGFAGDRRWLLTTPSGNPVMLKSHPAMTRLRIGIDGDGLVLSADGLPDLVVPAPGPDAERIEATVKRDIVAAAAAGAEADAWFAALLGDRVRLAHMPDDVRRPSKVDPTVNIGFAGDAPYLLVCDASLAELNAKLESPVGQDRFRANLAVGGGFPWQEEGWRALRIGGAVFEIFKSCDRCPNITVDPATGASNAEPLRTLSKVRLVDGKPCFGVFMGAREPGVISVGDAVEVLG
jgi:uncharacterized protein